MILKFADGKFSFTRN